MLLPVINTDLAMLLGCVFVLVDILVKPVSLVCNIFILFSSIYFPLHLFCLQLHTYIFLDNSTCLCKLGDACCGPDCKPLASSVLCRNATGDCDLAEYCDGKSGECPKGIFGFIYLLLF